MDDVKQLVSLIGVGDDALTRELGVMLDGADKSGTDGAGGGEIHPAPQLDQGEHQLHRSRMGTSFSFSLS